MNILGYISEWNFKGVLRPGDMDRLTHVNFAFALVKDGKGSVDHWKNGAHVKAFNQNKGHIKSLISVGGWGAGGFSNACLTAEGREKLAQSLVDISIEYGFDGIDMDWEYPCLDMAGIDAAPEDKENYTALIQLLREKQAPGQLVTMAAGAGKEFTKYLENEKIEPLMDFINLMTYDMCPWDKVGYHTALYPTKDGHSPNAAAAADFYEAAGWPRKKLHLGVAFYARNYTNVDGYGEKFEDKPHPGWIDYKEALPWGNSVPGGIQYDETAETAYFYDPNKREFLSFDTPRSIKAKKAHAEKTGMGGIFYWEYYCDTEDSELSKAMAE